MVPELRDWAGRVTVLLEVLQELGFVEEVTDLATRKRAWPTVKELGSYLDYDWRSDEGQAWLRENWAKAMALPVSELYRWVQKVEPGRFRDLPEWMRES